MTSRARRAGPSSSRSPTWRPWRRLDALDQADPVRPRGNWLARLREADGRRKFEVLTPDRGRGVLRDTDVIRLEGLKHLIGLPGTGKTTLIVLLLVWLDEHGYAHLAGRVAQYRDRHSQPFIA